MLSTNQIFRQLIYALSLGIAVSFYFFGWGIVIQIILAVITAVSCEAAVLAIRKKPVMNYITDGSAIITAMLLAISIPTIAPWWLIILGSAFAIILGKQLYGGLGNNLFNPAMLGYAFLLIAYPLPMTQWQANEFLPLNQSIQQIFTLASYDAISAPTPLDISNQTSNLSWALPTVWINLAYLLGGLYLLARKIIMWYIPVALLAGLSIAALLLNMINAESYAPMLFHLFTGATMLAAFFIATDPVTASTTKNGRLIYGFLIGLLIIMIRELGDYYPDGVAFSVLLVNIMVPLLDTYTQPKILGKR